MENQNNVRVVCRFRPINDMEYQRVQGLCVNFLSENTVSVNSQTDSAENLKFTFDKVFPPNSTQESVYNFAAKPIVEGVMQGFNGTVFAYGQTSSGKTYTMSGLNMEDPVSMGIIPRMVNTVFDSISDTDTNTEFTVKVSYCEIYLEKIKDLLNPTEANLKIHEDRVKGVFIEGLTEIYVSNDLEVYELMKAGNENREVAFTFMNAVSSRSHSLFIITVSQTNSKDFSGKVGKLFLVDLAGSEKVNKTGAAGLRLEEAKHINKSLTALGQVIYSLTDGKSTHIPYRDSKLTRVLQEALGGNSKTSLIVTCSPSPYNETETISSLRFGIRAKAIKNTPKVNREHTVAELKLLLAKSREEVEKRDRMIEKLEGKLKSQGDSTFDLSNTSCMSPGERIEADDIMAEIESLKIRLEEQIEISRKLKEANDSLQRENAELKSENTMMASELEEAQQRTNFAENSKKEQKLLIEKLVIAKESLEKNLENAMKTKMSSDKIISEKETVITQLKHEMMMAGIQPQKRKSFTYAVSPAELQKVKTHNSELINELEVAKEQQEAMNAEIARLVEEINHFKEKNVAHNRRTEVFESVPREFIEMKKENDELKKLLRQSQTVAERNKTEYLGSSLELTKIREENGELKKKMGEIQEKVDEILKSKSSKPKKSYEDASLFDKEKIYFNEERNKWEAERKDIMRDLENRINRVLELEINIDLANDSYRNLEKNIGKNEQSLIKQNQQLENYISKVSTEFQKELLLKEKIKADCEFYEKSLNDQGGKMKNLEAENEELKKKVSRLESRLKFAEEEAYHANSNKNHRPTMNFANVRRPIKGGQSIDRRSGAFMLPIPELRSE